MKQKNSAFTLIEVMISLMILSITMVSLMGGQLIALKTSQKAKFVTLATLAAKNIMEDIDTNIAAKGFIYVKDLGEKKEDDFEDEQYKGWKWKIEVKEVVLPISNIMKTFMASGGEDNGEEGGTQESVAGSGEEQILSLIAGSVEKVMKDSLREVSVTVSWPVKAGTEYSSLILVYYVVDFDAVKNFVPGTQM